MKNFNLLFIFVLIFLNIEGQEYCPSLEVEDTNGNTSVTIDCDYPLDTNECFSLEATYLKTYETTSYDVSSIDYSAEIPYNSGTEVNLGLADDKWGNIIDLPFTFCFYDNSFDKIIISDNGLVSFQTSLAGGSSVFTAATLPNSSLYPNTIYGLYHDLTNDNNTIGCEDDPNTPQNECGDIRVQTIGEAPCRKFIVNFNNLNHFGCSDKRSSFQVVLYETTNIIDINILEKPINCEPANPLSDYRKNATIGIMNSDGTQAVSPAGRNSAIFSITEESYRFTPTGSESTSIQWKNEAGNVVSTSSTYTVCDLIQQNYTVEVSYGNCYNTPLVLSKVFPVTISPNFPVANDIEISICDAELNNTEIIDLTNYYSAINTNTSAFTYSFHPTLLDARNNTNAISNVTSYSATNNTSIFVRLAYNATCFTTSKVDFRFKIPAEITSQDFYVCDPDNDGSVNVNLSNYSSILVTNSANYTITYYNSQNDAQNSTNAITTITLSSDTTLWVKAADGECEEIASFNLKYAETPQTNNVNLDLCYGSEFDLSTLNSQIYTGSQTVDYSYHVNLGQANQGSNPINPIVTIDRNTYFIRVTDPISGCFSVATINITYTDTSDVTDGDFTKCDTDLDEEEIFNLDEAVLKVIPNTDDYTYDFYETLAGAQNQDANVQIVAPDITNYLVDTPNKIIYVRVVDTITGCIIIKRLVLRVATLNPPFEDEIYACKNENSTEDLILQLHTLDSRIVGNGTQNPNAVVFHTEYYETLTDAENRENQIDEYTVTATHTLYVRIIVGYQEVDEDGNPVIDEDGFPVYEEICFGVYPITLILSTISDINEGPIDVCDNLNDGYELLNLSQFTTTYTSNPDYSNFTYINSTPIIINPNNALITSAQPFFYLVFNNENNCRVRVKYTLNFINIPLAAERTIKLCDFEDDNQETINLNDYNYLIINQPENYSFQYYNSYDDARYNFNPITNVNNYVVTPSTNVLYVRVINSNGCFNITKITFSFLEAPAIYDPIYVCTTDGSTSASNYTLSNFNSQILANATGFTVKYFTNINDAQNNANEVLVANIFDGQLWYIRLESSNGCVFILNTTIAFFQIPEVTTDLKICDNNNTQNQEITLAELNPLIVENSTDYNFYYYTTEEDLNNDTNAIADTESYTITNGSNLYVRIQYNHECKSLLPITVNFLEVVTYEDTSLFLCDNDNNLEETFDLTSALSAINPNFANYSISYYTNRQGANNQDVNSEISSDPTQYTSNNEFRDVFVRLEDESTGCYSVAKILLIVSPIPKLVNSTYNTCDINFDGEGDVNLSNLNALIIDENNNVNNLQFQYYESYQEAQNGVNQINNVENYSNPNSTFSIFIKVITEKGCYSIAEIKITTGEKTEINSISDKVLYLCDVDNDISEYGILNSYEQDISTNNVSFHYYYSFNDMSKEINEISNPSGALISTVNSTIYVRVKQEGFCDNYTQFNVTLLPTPQSEHESLILFCPEDKATLSVEEGYASYLWLETNETTPSIEVGTPGVYHVEITAENGCKTAYEITAQYYPTPSIVVNYEGTNTIFITNSSAFPLEYSLDGINFTNVSNFSNLARGVQTVYFKNVNTGCIYSQEFYISNLSNIITPDNDGYNDTWKIDDLYFFGNSPTKFKVYDRFGKMVYEQSSSTSIEWTGKYNGINLPSDAYWYSLELPDGRIFKGWILIRNAYNIQ